MKKVAIVIPAINLWVKYTKPCIDSVVKACEGLDYRILLIDNASSDETLFEAGKLVSSSFSHKRNNSIWGCSESWNWGVRDAFERGYDYVLILNNDVLLHPESVKQLIARFEKGDGDLAMATCLDITGECSEPLAVMDKDVAEKLSTPQAEHPCFSGFMINKKCWEQVGEFDENFKPAYFEDNSYHYRIKLAGMKAIVLPTAMFYHYGSRTKNESGIQTLTNEAFEKNRAIYVEMWGGLPGHETYTNPYNNKDLSYRKTKSPIDFDRNE